MPRLTADANFTTAHLDDLPGNRQGNLQPDRVIDAGRKGDQSPWTGEFSATHSISTIAPLGNPATAIVDRAGGFSGKNSA